MIPLLVILQMLFGLLPYVFTFNLPEFVTLLVSFEHDLSIFEDVFLLLTTSLTLLVSYTSFLLPFLKSFLRESMYFYYSILKQVPWCLY